MCVCVFSNQTGALHVDRDRGAGAGIQGRRPRTGFLLSHPVPDNVSSGQEGGGGGPISERAGVGDVLVRGLGRRRTGIGVGVVVVVVMDTKAVAGDGECGNVECLGLLHLVGDFDV